MKNRAQQAWTSGRLAPPVERKDRQGHAVFALELKSDLHNIYFECKASGGGLITAFSLDGINILADESVGPMYGSTFWTSPQSDWDWPPPPAIDMDTYTADVDETSGTITLMSAPEPALGVRFIKTFRGDAENGAIDIAYRIENIEPSPKWYAPWEISRVFPGGTTFYPTGSGAITFGDTAPFSTSNAAGVTWFHHTPSNVTAQHKLFADGSRGWLAHAKDKVVFVKIFEDTGPEVAAPGEGEIEIYATPEYEEVEQQGAYREIPPGESLVWAVRWILRALPDDATCLPGDRALLAFVESLV